jgi:hypothetical protein
MHTVEYKRRKIWLSICQVPSPFPTSPPCPPSPLLTAVPAYAALCSVVQTYEWEPVLDEESGSVYYRNNVSGDTQWEMPSDLDHLVSSSSSPPSL